MHRRRLLHATLAAGLAGQLGLLHSAWAAGRQLAPSGIYRFTGQVQVNGQAAREGLPIRPGDTVTTGPDSEVIYVVGQDAYLQRDRSTVSLTGDALKNGLRLLSGKLLAVFAKGDKLIETSTATIGIRGTGCYIEAEANRVYFCLCYGQAEVASLENPAHREIIETRHHDHPVYLHADGRRMMVPAEVVNHRDSELVLLESLVGRVPPFVGQSGYGDSY